jgi:uncharacterized membrane protein
MLNDSGLKRDTVAAITAVAGPTIIVPLLVLFLYKDDYVKFWAMQSLVTSLVMFIIFWGIGIFAFALFLAKIIAGINGLFMLAGFILWLVFVYKSWMGERWVAPVVGPIAIRLLKKLN